MLVPARTGDDLSDKTLRIQTITFGFRCGVTWGFGRLAQRLRSETCKAGALPAELRPLDMALWYLGAGRTAIPTSPSTALEEKITLRFLQLSSFLVASYSERN